MLCKLALCLLLMTAGMTAAEDSGNMTGSSSNTTVSVTYIMTTSSVLSGGTSTSTSNGTVSPTTKPTSTGSIGISPTSNTTTSTSNGTVSSTTEPASASSIGISPTSNTTTSTSNGTVSSTTEPASASSIGISPTSNTTTSTSNGTVSPTTEPATTSSTGSSPASSSTPSAGSTQITSNDTDSNNSSTANEKTTSAMITSTSRLCAPQSNHCKNGGTCDFAGSTCNCTSAWKGDICDEDVDECKDDKTHDCNTTISQCENKPGGYRCRCNDGYQQGDTDKKCIDIDECVISNNCTKHEVCINLEGTHDCKCNEDSYLDGGECKKLQTAKITKTWNFTSEIDFQDTASQEYKDLVQNLTCNITDELKNENPERIYRLHITSLRKGSVIAVVVVQLNSSKELVLPADSKEEDFVDEDFCVFNSCDEKSTICRGITEVEEYECVCKDKYERIPGVRYNCHYKGECKPGSTCSNPNEQCKEKDGIYQCVSNSKACNKLCKNDGICVNLASGESRCRCAGNYTGDDCGTQVVPLKSKKDLENILIGVGVGLGSLALFCSIALIIVCCSRDRSKEKPYSVVSKSNHLYMGDDVTIDTWEPSLPRPKIKTGNFRNSAGNSMEMNERDGMEGRERGAGAENPAFIPEADYDGGRGRLVNGKRRDSGLVYF